MFNLRRIFNMWRPFPKIKPKTKGNYICTVEVPGQQRYVMDLYWYPTVGRFKDNRRQTIFDEYDVYGYNNETKKNDKLLKTIGLCDRTINVVAWKEPPKEYMKGFVKDNIGDYY